MENEVHTNQTVQQTAPSGMPVGETPAVSVSQTPQKSGFSKIPRYFLSHKKIVVILLLIIIILTPLGIWFFQNINSNTKKTNAPVQKQTSKVTGDVLLATVGDKKIYKDDVKKIALEIYIGPAVTSEVMKTMLNTAVERAILDRVAFTKGISLPQQKTPFIYYVKLKEKVSEDQILSITEQDISWWIPPPPYEQKPEFEVQRQNQEAMAAEIERRFKNGEDPYMVAKDMIAKYKMFEQTLGYNGANISKANNAIIPGDRTLVYSSSDSSKPFFKLLYSMNTGQIQKGVWEDGSGGAVIKAKSVSKGKNMDYDVWLSDIIKKEVVYNTEEISKL